LLHGGVAGLLSENEESPQGNKPNASTEHARLKDARTAGKKEPREKKKENVGRRKEEHLARKQKRGR
jgi:hypothetical protein